MYSKCPYLPQLHQHGMILPKTAFSLREKYVVFFCGSSWKGTISQEAVGHHPVLWSVILCGDASWVLWLP